MYRKFFIISAITAVFGFSLAGYLSNTMPYSDYEPILLFLGGISLAAFLLTFVSYSYKKGFLHWLMLIIGWILMAFYTVTAFEDMNSAHPIDAPGLIGIFVLFWFFAILLLIVSLITFIVKYIKHREIKNMLGIILCLVPVIANALFLILY